MTPSQAMALHNFTTGPWRRSLSDFSEIDTSDVTTDLSDVPGLHQIKEIINNEEVLTNTDYMNQNLFIRKMDDQDLCLPPLIATDYIQSEIEIAILEPLDNLAAIATGDATAALVDKSFPEKMKKPTKKRKKKVVYGPGFLCVVCKKVFLEKKGMKSHVLRTHLRKTVQCEDCGKGVFQDKLTQHQDHSCSASRKH